MKYMCREFPDEFVVEANSVEEAEEILDCMGCYMQDEEDGTIPCDGPVPVERGMSKKMCEVCHKNSDEVPDREEIRPVVAAAPAMMEALVGAKWAMESYISKQLLEQMDEYKDVVKALRKARGEEIEANGSLIEAAPYMLKALVEVKMRIEEYITTCPLCGESAERGHKYYCLWHVANDAIQKARGEG